MRAAWRRALRCSTPRCWCDALALVNVTALQHCVNLCGFTGAAGSNRCKAKAFNSVLRYRSSVERLRVAMYAAQSSFVFRVLLQFL